MQEQFKPLEIQDFIKRDIVKTIRNDFIGKNKCVLTTDYIQGNISNDDYNKNTLKELESLLNSFKNAKTSKEKSDIRKDFEVKELKINFPRSKNEDVSKATPLTPIKKLLKIPEFGGRDPTRYERQQISALQKELLRIKKDDGIFIVPIKLGKKIYNVYEIVKHYNNVDKADVEFLDVKGRSIAWASLKKGNSPKDFQQWSGVSDRTSNFISSHNETRQFISKVRELKENSQDNAQSTYMKKINDGKIKNIAIFGGDYGSNPNKKTPNNVTTVIQDEYTKLKIQKENNYYVITGDLLIRNNKLPDSYDPTFFARPDSKRNDAGIQKTRLGIFPRDYRTGNKILEIK